jgi:hypothetical protein
LKGYPRFFHEFPMTTAKIERQAAEEAFEQGFHGIPDPKQRAIMSPEMLAIELFKLEKGSPPYILLEHELNLRLAKEQAKATLSAGWLGASATVLAALATFALGLFAGTLQQPKEPSACISEKTSTTNASQPDSKATGVVPKVETHAQPVLVAPLSGSNDQGAAHNHYGKPDP